jgi:LuxR family transcriptional regulator
MSSDVYSKALPLAIGRYQVSLLDGYETWCAGRSPGFEQQKSRKGSRNALLERLEKAGFTIQWERDHSHRLVAVIDYQEPPVPTAPTPAAPPHRFDAVVHDSTPDGTQEPGTDYGIQAVLLPETVEKIHSFAQVKVHERLSRREIESLLWYADGKTAWEIGVILGITERTVNAHLSEARGKLQAVNTQQAVARLIAMAYEGNLPHRSQLFAEKFQELYAA